MDKADSAEERPTIGDSREGLEGRSADLSLATVIQFPPSKKFAESPVHGPVTLGLLNDELERFDPGLPLTQTARDFLKEVLASVLSGIPSDADLFEFKKRIAKFIETVFRLLVSGGWLGIPKNLPKREKPIAETIILHTAGMDRITAQKVSAWPFQTSEIRFQIERVLADCLFLDKTLERHGNRWKPFMIEREINRTVKRLDGVEAIAQKLRDEAPVTKRTLREGARTCTAIDHAEQVAGDYEYARGKAHLMMVQESTTRTPQIIRTKVPTHVDRQVVIDCLVSDRKRALQRCIALLRRQMDKPVPLDPLTQSLSERDSQKLSYSHDVDPILVIHEIVRRATSDVTCTRPEVLRMDLMREVFDNGRTLLATIRRPRTVRLNDGEMTIDAVIGFKPWMPN